MATAAKLITATDEADYGLPAWAYTDADMLAAEKARVFAPSWQIVCHLNDIPDAGDWRQLSILGENIVAVRGEDNTVRAFANVCRHRGARILDGSAGCAKKLICPYHAWTFELDGRLSGVPNRRDYPALDPREHSLVEYPIEIWRGFVFASIATPPASVAEMMAPFEAEIAPYRLEEMQAIGRVTTRPRPANWKNISDNYSDGLHIPVAHPGLKRLFPGDAYAVQATEWVDRLGGPIALDPKASLSERLYFQHLPNVDHLPADRQRYWFYYKLWPNVAFDLYADQIDFMQFIPLTPDTTMIRETAYALPDDRREMRVARALNWRINRRVSQEDSDLVARVQDGMKSSSFVRGPLGTSEVCLRALARRMRTLVPEVCALTPPPAGWGRIQKPLPFRGGVGVGPSPHA
ncbi:Rieske domain-containing protein [Sphingomonas antarctica]|uniref:aromatic ring-hydroxylating oxygenase subunit alpha n=1 Tax=Sphingomonas antarctica TaxID=2040274 RepID=UPI0039E7D7F6